MIHDLKMLRRLSLPPVLTDALGVIALGVLFLARSISRADLPSSPLRSFLPVSKLSVPSHLAPAI